MTRAAKPATRERTRPSRPASVFDRPLPEARPRSEITGRHDEGSGANETIDGLDELQEAARHGAEDIPAAEAPEKPDAVPVFDRADSEPKV